jgi:hypothetical protein
MQSEYFILDVYFILFFRELVCILVGDYLFASNLYLYTRECCHIAASLNCNIY